MWLKKDNPEAHEQMKEQCCKTEHFINDVEKRLDEIHASNILKIFAAKIKKTTVGVMMYDEKLGLWSSDKGVHMKIIQRCSEEIFENSEYNDKKKTFTQLYNCAYPLACVQLELDDEFNSDKNIGYLLFKNGVLDMQNFTMLPHDPKYCFTKQINRDFNTDKFYDDVKAEIENKLFENPIPDVTKRKFCIENIARGIAGKYKYKEFMFGIGETNCGKGVLTALMKGALCGFFGTFNGEELLGGRSGGDSAVKWKWIADIWDCRIIVSNEFEITTTSTRDRFNNPKKEIVPLNGHTLKVLVSGGDEINVRKLYMNQIQVIIKAFVVLLVNDIPQVTGTEFKSYVTRANYVTFDRSSSSDVTEADDVFFPADETIKDYIERVDVMDGFIALICERYAASEKDGKMAKPECVKQDTEQMIGVPKCLREWLADRYEFYVNSATPTNDVVKDFTGKQDAKKRWTFDKERVGKWMVSYKSAYDWYVENAEQISQNKFTQELKKVGVFKSEVTEDGRKRERIVGLKLPTQECRMKDQEEY